MGTHSQETEEPCSLVLGKSFHRLKRKWEENILYFYEPLPEGAFLETWLQGTIERLRAIKMSKEDALLSFAGIKNVFSW